MVHPKFLNRLGEKNATEKETKDKIGYPGIIGILQWFGREWIYKDIQELVFWTLSSQQGTSMGGKDIFC